VDAACIDRRGREPLGALAVRDAHEERGGGGAQTDTLSAADEDLAAEAVEREARCDDDLRAAAGVIDRHRETVDDAGTVEGAIATVDASAHVVLLGSEVVIGEQLAADEARPHERLVFDASGGRAFFAAVAPRDRARVLDDPARDRSSFVAQTIRAGPKILERGARQ